MKKLLPVALPFLLFALLGAVLYGYYLLTPRPVEPAPLNYKPCLYYGDALYPLSPHGSPDTLPEEGLTRVGTVQSTVPSTTLPTENFQVCSYEQLLDCPIYRLENYPDTLFVYDPEGHPIAFALEDPA